MRSYAAVWAVFLTLAGLLPAAEQKGVVKSGSLPIPGATVTASQGETRVSVASDDEGRYTFRDLPAGQWTLTVEMFGFTTATKTLRVPEDGELSWDLPLAARAAAPQRAAGAGARLALSRTGRSNEVMSELESMASAGPTSASLQQDANESLLVSGSLSRGLQMEAQNLMGPPGMGMGGPGGMEGPPPEGGPGMMGGPGGPGGPGMMAAGGGRAGGGPMMGGGGPGGGGPPMGGGGGPMGGPGGGMGGPGGEMGGGRGGRMGGRPEWAGQRGVSAFGNRQGRGREGLRGMAGLSYNASALDAKPYSLTGNSITRPDYSKVRFNIGLGGRLVIPKLIKSDSTFFFLNYSGGRNSNAMSRVGTVPSLLERAGDFSASQARGAVTIYDPTTNLPFPNNKIPTARVDSAAAGLLAYIPTPNLPGTVQNYQFVTSVPQNNDMFSVRLGHSLSSKDRLSGGFQIQQRHSENAQLFGYRDESDGRGSSWNASWTHNIKATLINDLHVTFSRNRSETVPHFANGTDVARELGIQGASTEPRNYGPPNLSFTNFAELSDSNPSLRRDQNIGFGNGLTWVVGKHTLKFGFDYRRNQVNSFTDDNGRGTFSFSGLLTSAFDGDGNPLANTGFDMADFLLGLPQTSSVRWGNSSMYFRGANYSAYAQEDWRVNSGLSLSMGLRYEYTQPMYEKYNRIANLDVAAGFTDVAVVTPDIAGPYSGQFPRGLVNPDRNNISPRIGVAWKPNPRKSLQIRAGYGVYFNGSVYNAMVSRLGQQPPFALANSFTTSLADPLTIREGLLGSAATGITNTLAVARDYAVGYAQTWNVSVQRQLPGSLVGEIGYLATKGTRLDTQRLPNQAPPGSPADSENRRPIPYAVGFLYESAEGNSIMHSGQLRLMRRFRRGVSFQALYTWSKSIDNVSTYGGGQAVVAQNDRDLAAERGLSSFDQRHNLNVSFMLTSPAGRGPALFDLGRWNVLLKDWTLNGGITARSGNPLTATVLGNRADSGGTGVVGSGRANATGEAIDSGSGFFNLAAFTLPAANAFGNAGRNTIPGPGQFVMNAGIGRSFPIGSERRQAEFRVEADNALNSVNYTRYGTTINASNYGLATSAGSMRSVTANLRVRF